VPPPALLAFAREFNAGRYFEAHEALEEGLEELPEEHWDLWIGLIQVAVGYHKRAQGLRGGAAGMLRRGLEKMRAFPAAAAGLELEPLRVAVAEELRRLEGRTDGEEAAATVRIRFVKRRRGA